MRIVQIIPGSGGGFYCENCMRDTGLVRALRGLGHDVLMVPMYLPLFTDDPGPVAAAPVFFGGINVYLQQQSALFRRLPRAVSRLFDAPWLLRLAARRAGSTRARGLGEMTLSMLRGEDGRQAGELDRLVAWLAESERPDIVHLSNALLIGLARRLRETLGARVVCSLQDEDSWLDAMDPDESRACWDAIRERAAHVDAFVSVSRFYAERMAPRLGLAPGRMHVAHVGVDAAGRPQAPLDFNPPTLGFLSRTSYSQGLDLLVEAFLRLKAEPPFARLRLRVTGGGTGDDRRFLAGLRRRLRAAGAERDADFVEDFGRDSRLAFLASLSVLSVPVRTPEALGLFVIEAMAAGVPVVQPRHGAFPEVVEPSGAGLLYDPAAPDGLYRSLRELLGDPARARELGRRGRQAFLDSFTLEQAAARLQRIYTTVTGGGKAAT